MPFFPRQMETLIEPFAGSAAISIAAACAGKASRFHLNDINKPLMTLWRSIINHPEEIADGYERLWVEQQGRERRYYDQIRDLFNKTQEPQYLFYLLARCVKASIRYNAKGEFNQSPDNRRLGRNPDQMKEDIFAVSNLFHGRAKITSVDYRDVIDSATKDDLVYMDPPYQGVCGTDDPRYYSNGVKFEEFILALESLVRRRISFVLSYDGRTGTKTYGKQLPRELGLGRIEINAGRSTQLTLLGKSENTFEAIYLSSDLMNRLEITEKELARQVGSKAIQLAFA
ncbi:MAG: DNA adenine methylase [Chloroflexi bacterium]|nr:DNA adenine methylase [Chloroflexota bacterium]